MAVLALKLTSSLLVMPALSSGHPAARLVNSERMAQLLRPSCLCVKRTYVGGWSTAVWMPEYTSRMKTGFGLRGIVEDFRASVIAQKGFPYKSGGCCRVEARRYMQHQRKLGDSIEITKAGDVQVPMPVEEKPTMVVSIFWDLDNKPPQDVPPFDVARRLREAASAFGHVVDFIAYANHHAFDYVPQWVREERKERKALDWEEKKGLHVPEKPYVCGVCGNKFVTNIKLKKHFKQLHERERNKRMSHMNSVSSAKRRAKMREANAPREMRYQEAVKGILVPKRGYGLASDIKRAGVFVKTVPDKPQAADRALKMDMLKAIGSGVDCICLVSDDGDFRADLEAARRRKLRTVVIGNGSRLSQHGDIFLSWHDISTGRARRLACDAVSHWSEEDALVQVLEEEDGERDDNQSGSRSPRPMRTVRDEWDNADLHTGSSMNGEMNGHFGRRQRLSVFSEEEEWDLVDEEVWDEKHLEDDVDDKDTVGDDDDDDDDDDNDDEGGRRREDVHRVGGGMLRWWEVETQGVATRKSSSS